MAIQKKIYIGSASAANELEFVSGGASTSLADNSVKTSTIQDGAVTNAKISSVSASKISGQLSSNNIPTLSMDKIKDDDDNFLSDRLNDILNKVENASDSSFDKIYYAKFKFYKTDTDPYSYGISFCRVGNIVFGSIGGILPASTNNGKNTSFNSYTSNKIDGISTPFSFTTPYPIGSGAAAVWPNQTDAYIGARYYTGIETFPPKGFEILQGNTGLLPYVSGYNNSKFLNKRGYWCINQVSGEKPLIYSQTTQKNSHGALELCYDRWGIKHYSNFTEGHERISEFSYLTNSEPPTLGYLADHYRPCKESTWMPNNGYSETSGIQPLLIQWQVYQRQENGSYTILESLSSSKLDEIYNS